MTMYIMRLQTKAEANWPILDARSRKAVGYALPRRTGTPMTLAALKAAYKILKPATGRAFTIRIEGTNMPALCTGMLWRNLA